MAGPGSYNIHPGRLTAGSPTAITRLERKMIFQPNLHEDMFHVNLPGCKLQRSKNHLRPKKLDPPGDDSMAGAALAGEVDTEYGVPW